MELLIDDLLSFSRLSRVDMNFSRIDMSGIVRGCFEELTDDTMKKKISLTISDFPLVRGDYAMLVQVWTNLLSNAIKYTSLHEHPEIRIGCSLLNNELTYCIEDNGIGFDMKYAERLFGVFQRLHSGRDYEGTGVGLAIVQRIIQRHGGKIWAEAELNKGARFYFTVGGQLS
jgi:light-regulated signal transduction histidine kinase (bacteriophytochrome)